MNTGAESDTEKEPNNKLANAPKAMVPATAFAKRNRNVFGTPTRQSISSAWDVPQFI